MRDSGRWLRQAAAGAALAVVLGLGTVQGCALRRQTTLVASDTTAIVVELRLGHTVPLDEAGLEPLRSALGGLGVDATDIVPLQALDPDGRRFHATSYLVPIDAPSRATLDVLKTLQSSKAIPLPNVSEVRLHSNPPRIVRQGMAAACEREASLEGEKELRKLVCGGKPCPPWEGEGVGIAVVDERFCFEFITARHDRLKLLVDLGLVEGRPAPPADGTGLSSSHGTMCAYLATVFAPAAALIEFGSAPDGKSRALGAHRAYLKIGEDVVKDRTPPRGLVVTNSWELGESAALETFCERPWHGVISTTESCHFLNQSLRELAKAKVDIVFAAGNRGQCAQNPGRLAAAQIVGANSHPDVLTVGAVDIAGRRIRTSSQGPGFDSTGLSYQKPDASTYSNYSVSHRLYGTGKDYDTETSAAAALAAGMVAAVRSAIGPDHHPATVRCLLLNRARHHVYRADASRPLDLTTYDSDFGHGILHLEGWDPVQDLKNGICTPKAEPKT